MDLAHVLLGSLIFVSVPAAVYGFHRLCLWLEKRGWLYYKHKKPNSSAGCFVALQQILEPPTQHIVQVKEEKRHPARHKASEQDDRKPAGGNV